MIRCAMVCEARADFETAGDLTDRVLIKSTKWLDEDLIEHQREWRRHSNGDRFLRWDKVDDLARTMSLRAQGKFGDEPAQPDALAARRAIRALAELFEDLHVIFLIRDSDDQESRRAGLEQARTEFQQRTTGQAPRIVVGVAITKRECWVLAGFEPRNAHETRLLDEERRFLGFDPQTEAHQLTAKSNPTQDKRSAKRVLAKLVGSDRDRERECWRETAFEILRARGASTGLTEFLDEIESYVVPLLRTQKSLRSQD